MVEKFENGKVYAQKGDEKPYELIFEAATYHKSGLMIDCYVFTETVHSPTQGRIYSSKLSLEPPSNYNPEDFEEIGEVGKEFKILNEGSLVEAKPSYKQLEAALQEIIAAKPSDFSNYHKMASKLQLIAQSVWGAK